MKDSVVETTQRAVPRLTAKEFAQLSQFIHTEYGIKLPPVKMTMLESRLHKRLRATGKPDFKEYCEYLFSKEGQEKELIQMVDLVTTNKTDFFREPAHFSFLREQWLPEWLENRSSVQEKLKIWSAGCSSGEEPYTLAMVLQEFSQECGIPVDYAILGTDLSTEILSKAVKAIYTEEKAAGIPLSLKKKYLLRSKSPGNNTVRIIPALRAKTSYMRLNFMDAAYDVPDEYHIIFCRNVLIYFDRATQEKVINRLCKKLKPGGYLFLGHSESITSMQVPLKQIKPTIFTRL